MGAQLSRARHQASKVLIIKSYTAAGLLFTDGKHVLAGWQPNKRRPCVTGIGGSREAGEKSLDTAMREAVEELFDVKDVGPELIVALQETLRPAQRIQQDRYVSFVYSFEDLGKFLAIVRQYGIQSPLYKEFPVCVEDLIFDRDIVSSAEVQQLVLLPFVQGFGNGCTMPLVSPDFLEDLSLVGKGLIPNTIVV